MNLKKFISGISAFAVAASAFAGLAVTANAYAEVVGNTNFTTTYDSVASQYISLKQGEQSRFEFKNYSDKKTNWDNWYAYVSNDADFKADGYTPITILRADSWVNMGGGTVSHNYNYDDLNAGLAENDPDRVSEADNYPQWRAAMDGSDVVVTFTYAVGGTLTIHADITTKAGETYYEEYVQTGVTNETIRTFLSVQNGYMVISKAEKVDSSLTEVDYIGSSTTKEGFSDSDSHKATDYFSLTSDSAYTSITNATTEANYYLDVKSGNIRYSASNKVAVPGKARYTMNSTLSNGMLTFNALVWFGNNGSHNGSTFSFLDSSQNQVLKISFPGSSGQASVTGNNITTNGTTGKFYARSSSLTGGDNSISINVSINLDSTKANVTLINNMNQAIEVFKDIAITSDPTIKYLDITSTGHSGAATHTYVDDIVLYANTDLSSTTFNYAFKAVNAENNNAELKTLTSGDVLPSEVNAYINKVIEVDGNFYALSEESEENYVRTETVTANGNNNFSVSYVPATDIVYYSEIGTGTTSGLSGGGSATINGAGSYTDVDQGVYDVIFRVSSLSSPGQNTPCRKQHVERDGNQIGETISTVGTHTVRVVVSSADGGRIAVKGDSSNNTSDYLDYIMIKKVSDYERTPISESASIVTTSSEENSEYAGAVYSATIDGAGTTYENIFVTVTPKAETEKAAKTLGASSTAYTGTIMVAIVIEGLNSSQVDSVTVSVE